MIAYISCAILHLAQDQNDLGAGDQVLEEQGLNGGKLSPAVSTLTSDSSSIHNVNVSEIVINNASGSGAVVPEAFVSSGLKIPMMVGKTSETALLDERALLACIVRTIPAGSRIQISSTVSFIFDTFIIVAIILLENNILLVFCLTEAICSFKCQLPNRLCKMLAPLHWHDYEKKYGKLEDLVAGHPEVRFSRT